MLNLRRDPLRMSHSDEDNDFDLVEEAYEYKINGNYPEGCTAYQKKSIRRKASKMILCGGEIFLTRKGGKVLVSTAILLIWLPMEFVSIASYCVLSHFN